MTSEGSSRVIPSYGVVSAAKAALESHVRQLAMELARNGSGIAVNCIRAGVTDTPALRKIPEANRMVEITLARNPHAPPHDDRGRRGRDRPPVRGRLELDQRQHHRRRRRGVRHRLSAPWNGASRDGSPGRLGPVVPRARAGRACPELVHGHRRPVDPIPERADRRRGAGRDRRGRHRHLGLVGSAPGRRTEVEAAERLAFLMSPSVGLDNLDLGALTAAGVVVANTAGRNAPSVAEWCLGAAFAVARSLAWVDREVRDGRWPQLELPERGSTELAGLRVGVLGFGAVGSRVARLFGAIGCDVAYWTRTRRSADEEAGSRWLPLDELIERLRHPRRQPLAHTRNPGPGRREPDRALPRGAIVVDAGRGGIVDHVALVAAVETGRAPRCRDRRLRARAVAARLAAAAIGSDPVVEPRGRDDRSVARPDLRPRRGQRPAGDRG